MVHRRRQRRRQCRALRRLLPGLQRPVPSHRATLQLEPVDHIGRYVAPAAGVGNRQPGRRLHARPCEPAAHDLLERPRHGGGPRRPRLHHRHRDVLRGVSGHFARHLGRQPHRDLARAHRPVVPAEARTGHGPRCTRPHLRVPVRHPQHGAGGVGRLAGCPDRIRHSGGHRDQRALSPRPRPA